MRELALFAGAGGGILGGMLAGWHTVCAVERDAYRAAILAGRQNDEFLPPFPIWSDVCSFDGLPWRGLIDVVSAGFPCQDISVAGTGKGLDSERSGVGWRETWRIVGEVQPRYLWLENSPAIIGRGAYAILAEIAKIGGVARWEIVSGAQLGAWHERKRWWLVADFKGVWQQQCKTTGDAIWQRLGNSVAQQFAGGDAANLAIERCNARRECIKDGSDGQKERRMLEACAIIAENDANFDGTGCEKQRRNITIKSEHAATKCCSWWATEPGVVRMVHGMANRVDRVAALGNGQIPIVVQSAWGGMMK